MSKKQNPTDPRTAIKAALRDYSEADAVRVLLGIVADYGRDHFEAGYQDNVKQSELVGLELATVYNATQVTEIAYAAWEDMNAHDANRWLAWYWPEVCGYKDTRDLQALRRVIAEANRKGIVIHERNADNDTVETLYNVTVKAEVVK